MILADDLDDAATKAVKVADIVRQAEEIQVGVSFELFSKHWQEFSRLWGHLLCGVETWD